MFKKLREIREMKKTKLQLETILLGNIYTFMTEKEQYMDSVKKILNCVKDINDVEEIKKAVIHEFAVMVHETNVTEDDNVPKDEKTEE